MADQNLQYTVTFKTRSEGDGAQKTAAAVRDLRAEQERINALETPSKLGVTSAGYYDLSEAVNTSTRAVKVNYQAGIQEDAQRATAIATVRRLKEEEAAAAAAKQKLAAAAGIAAGGTRNLTSAAAGASHQLQDMAVQMQMGTKMSTIMSQQLPQLLSVFGPTGAIAAGVISVGMLVYNLVTAERSTKAAAEAAKELADKLAELQQTRAAEFVRVYAEALDAATERQNDLHQAEIDRLGTQAQVDEANRRVQKSQDDLTAAALRYLETVEGIDVTAQRLALEQAGAQREAESATAAQTLKVDEQRAKYAELTRQIDELKTNTAAWKDELDAANVKAAELADQAALAGQVGRTGLQGDLEMELAKVQAKAAELDAMLKDAPKRIADLTAEAFRQAFELDATLATAEANVAAINAELQTKTETSQINAAIESNRKITGDLTAALGSFQVMTPAQAEAAAAIAAALADGRVTAEESAAVARDLQTLLTGLTSAQTANAQTLQAAYNEVKRHEKAIREMEVKFQELRNQGMR
jgi:hypothetical protein